MPYFVIRFHHVQPGSKTRLGLGQSDPRQFDDLDAIVFKIQLHIKIATTRPRIWGRDYTGRLDLSKGVVQSRLIAAIISAINVLTALIKA